MFLTIPSEEAKQQAMIVTIHNMDEVWTSDNLKLGVAHSLYYRPEEQVRPADQLYAAYLGVMNFELGDDYYVPTDFLQRVDAEQDQARLELTVPMKAVMDRTWSRAPEFVAKGLGRRVPLPEAESEAMVEAGLL